MDGFRIAFERETYHGLQPAAPAYEMSSPGVLLKQVEVGTRSRNGRMSVFF
jgi:hypothetical protein